MAEILLCKPGAITTKAARQLGKAGIVVVETDNPSNVKFVRAGEVITGSAMLTAALTALAKSPSVREARDTFVELLAAASTTHNEV